MVVCSVERGHERGRPSVRYSSDLQMQIKDWAPLAFVVPRCLQCLDPQRQRELSGCDRHICSSTTGAVDSQFKHPDVFQENGPVLTLGNLETDSIGVCQEHSGTAVKNWQCILSIWEILPVRLVRNIDKWLGSVRCLPTENTQNVGRITGSGPFGHSW